MTTAALTGEPETIRAAPPTIFLQMKTNFTMLLFALTAGLSGSVYAEELSLESVPPVVVQTIPAAGDAAVDPALTEIKVTFSKAMHDGTWSWSAIPLPHSTIYL